MSDEHDRGRVRRRRWVVVVVVVLGLAAAAWAWPGLWNGATQEDTPTDGGMPEAGMQWIEQGDRDPLPDVSGTTLDGDALALSDLRGQVVVVNIWGSWCGPCRAEAPDLARVARETKADGVRFVGIDTRDNKTAARAFTDQYEVPYPSLYDPDGSLIVELNGVIPINAVPSTIVVDREGHVAARVIGKVTYPTLRGLVDDVLAETNDRAGTSQDGAT